MLISSGPYQIIYYSEEVEQQILGLPDTLAARYMVLTSRMIVYGSNLGSPHTEALGDGLFELRIKGAEGIGSVKVEGVEKWTRTIG